VWQRFLTIFAGPATNYLSAIVLAMLLYNLPWQRRPLHWYGISAVMKDYDAASSSHPATASSPSTTSRCTPTAVRR